MAKDILNAALDIVIPKLNTASPYIMDLADKDKIYIVFDNDKETIIVRVVNTTDIVTVTKTYGIWANRKTIPEEMWIPINALLQRERVG